MKKMTPEEIKAKLAVLEELMNMAGAAEGDELENDFKGLKKVTVASNDKAGLEEGLDKAHDLMETMPDKDMDDALQEDMKEMQPEEKMSLPEEKVESKDPKDEEDDQEMNAFKMKNIQSKKKKGYLSDLV